MSTALTVNAPLALVDQYIGNGKQYRAISSDVGDQDGLRSDATRLHEVLDRHGLVDAFTIYPSARSSAWRTASRSSSCRSTTFAS
jgi:hypothetical protein